MQKNKKIIIVFVLCLFCIYIVNYFVNSSKNMDTLKSTKNHLNFNNSLALMFETEKDSGEYIQSNDSVWPTGDYVYNETLSKCEKGSKISYNENTKKVIVEANVSDRCYVYFDIEPKILFTDYIKGLYSTNGVNNLYLHDSNLANSANDGSYRYAGSSDTTNNYICFGSDAITCPNDDLYRIIGVFGNQVKLIKYDYATTEQLGTDGDFGTSTYSKNNFPNYKGSLTTINGYYYNYKVNNSASNNWKISLLNKTNLNKNYITYLNNRDAKWVKMTVDTKWNIGGHPTNSATAITFITAEKVQQTSEASKIGLMQVSDYGYAILPSYWSRNLNSIGTIKDNNWMYMGLIEWTITPYSSEDYRAFSVDDSGHVNVDVANNGLAVRPVLYLKADVTYVSGDGTQSSPYRIS